MFKPNAGYCGFSVLDLAKTRDFYSQTLGLKVTDDEMGIQLHLPGGARVFIYQKDTHQPATYTVLNLVVDDIDQSVADLVSKGVKFEQYNLKDFHQDEKGIARGLAAGHGPDIAWFTDPSQNIIGLLQVA